VVLVEQMMAIKDKMVEVLVVVEEEQMVVQETHLPLVQLKVQMVEMVSRLFQDPEQVVVAVEQIMQVQLVGR
jgi:hypothetical protein